MARITKEKILKGIENIEEVEIKAIGGELPLRPLSYTECLEIEEIEAKAYGSYTTESRTKAGKKGRRQIKNNKENESESVVMGKLNYSQFITAESKAKLKALHYSMNNAESEKWTEEEIVLLGKKAIEEIYLAVRKITGMDEDSEELLEEAKDFP